MIPCLRLTAMSLIATRGTQSSTASTKQFAPITCPITSEACLADVVAEPPLTFCLFFAPTKLHNPSQLTLSSPLPACSLDALEAQSQWRIYRDAAAALRRPEPSPHEAIDRRSQRERLHALQPIPSRGKDTLPPRGKPNLLPPLHCSSVFQIHRGGGSHGPNATAGWDGAEASCLG